MWKVSKYKSVSSSQVPRTFKNEVTQTMRGYETQPYTIHLTDRKKRQIPKGANDSLAIARQVIRHRVSKVQSREIGAVLRKPLEYTLTLTSL